MSSLRRSLLGGAALAGVALALGASCGDADVLLAALGGDCVLDSECADPLVCRFRRCHEACVTTADCAAGQRCVEADSGRVCLLDVESLCVANSDCPDPLVCAVDGRCRNECRLDPDCVGGQQCSRERACAEPGELVDGHLPGAAPGDAPCHSNADCVAPERCLAGRCARECTRDADCPSSRCVDSRCAASGPIGVDCVPGAQVACTCSDGSAGVWLCNAEGTTFGPDCLGCPTATTTDCPPPQPPDAAFACMAPLAIGPSLVAIPPMVQMANGRTMMTGAFFGPTDFGDGNVVAPVGLPDAFVAVYDASCALVGLQTFGVAAGQVEVVEAADDRATGDVWLLGDYVGQPDLGFGPLSGPQGAFLSKYDASGVLQAVADWPTTGTTNVFNLALSASPAGPVVAGTYSGTLDVEGQLLTMTSATTQEMFLVKLTPSLGLDWAKTFSASGTIGFPSSTWSALSSASGDVSFAGRVVGQVDFGDGLPFTGMGEGFVATYDAQGTLRWRTTFDALPPLWLGELPGNQLLAWGDQSNGADLGQGPLPTGPYRLTLDAQGGASLASAASGLRPFDVNAGGAALTTELTPANATLTIGACSVDVTQQDALVVTGPLVGQAARVRVFSHPMAGFGVVNASMGTIGDDGSATLLLTVSPSVTAHDFGAGPVSGDVFLVRFTAPP